MSFSENLKFLRKEKQLSQEALAEMLDVSRQAISKWEQGIGYPTTEKMLLLSSTLNVSLDSLTSAKTLEKTNNEKTEAARTIAITSPHENVTASCYRVSSSGKLTDDKLSPQYALFGDVDDVEFPPDGEPPAFLGWYADEEQVTKEIVEIQDAISSGIATYTLKYSVKTEIDITGITIIEEQKEYPSSETEDTN